MTTSPIPRIALSLASSNPFVERLSVSEPLTPPMVACLLLALRGGVPSHGWRTGALPSPLSNCPGCRARTGECAPLLGRTGELFCDGGMETDASEWKGADACRRFCWIRCLSSATDRLAPPLPLADFCEPDRRKEAARTASSTPTSSASIAVRLSCVFWRERVPLRRGFPENVRMICERSEVDEERALDGRRLLLAVGGGGPYAES